MLRIRTRRACDEAVGVIVGLGVSVAVAVVVDTGVIVIVGVNIAVGGLRVGVGILGTWQAGKIRKVKTNMESLRA